MSAGPSPDGRSKNAQPASESRRATMRFLCVYRPGKPETNTPPNEQEMCDMSKLIEEMTRAGVLLAAEGCQSSSKGARVRIDSRGFAVTDGPFPETKELIA